MTFSMNDLNMENLNQAAIRKLTPHDNCKVINLDPFSAGVFPRMIELRLPGDDGAVQTALWDGSLDLEVDDFVIADEYAGQTVWRISDMGGNDSGAGKQRVSKVWESDFGAVTLQADATGQIEVGKLTGPDAKFEILDTAGAQLRLTFEDGVKFVDFTLDTNHDLIVTPSSTGQVIFQPTTDSADFFQVLDADGGTPVLNVDTIGENVGIRTLPTAGIHLHVKSTNNTVVKVESTDVNSSCGFEWENDAQLWEFRLSSSDDITFRDETNSLNPLTILSNARSNAIRIATNNRTQFNNNTDSSHFSFYLLQANRIGMVIRGFTAQTSDLMQIQATGGTVLNVIDANGNLGLGNSSPGTKLHAIDEDAITAAITDIETIGHNSSGTPAANFGAGLLYQLESGDNTEDRDAARIAALWTTATDASRTSALVFETVDNAGSLTEQVRITGTGLETQGERIVSTETHTGTGTMADTVEKALCNSASPFTLTLPAHKTDKEIEVKNIGAGTVTLSPTSGLVRGSATQFLASREDLMFLSDNTNWN